MKNNIPGTKQEHEEHTLSPGVELKSPAIMTEGSALNSSETWVRNLERRDSRYWTWACFTSAQSGSLEGDINAFIRGQF